MNSPSVYLRVGDWVSISSEGLYLSVESLTQSNVTMADHLPNPINSLFILSTPKLLELAHREDKPLDQLSQDEVYFGEALILVHLVSGKYLSYGHEIDNKSSIELVNTLKANCEFAIKPIFKCQTVVSRKIRNEEEIFICPASMKNREGNMAMVLLKGDSRSLNRSYVCMKKNEQTSFYFCRKSLQNKCRQCVTNLQVHQLMNVETKKLLFMEVNHTKHRDEVRFDKRINEYASYFDIRIADSDYASLNVKQTQVSYSLPVYLHSWKEDKYLSIDLIGDVCLTEIPTEHSLFLIEPYNSDELADGSIVRLKHVGMQKYLSIEGQQDKIEMKTQARLIDTFFMNKVFIDDLRLTIFINDAYKILSREISGEKLSYRNKKHISKILKELVFYIFGDLFTLADFLSLKSSMTKRLSPTEQKLLAEVGILEVLVSLCKMVVREYQEENEKHVTYDRKDNTEEQNIVYCVMMCFAGVCSHNPENTRLLMKELPFLYDCVEKLPGIIEFLFHLFSGNKELLLILENTTHSVGKKEVPSIEILINCLELLNFDTPTKGKILTLLEALTIVKGKEKIVGHEDHILRAMQSHRLDNVMLKLTSNDHFDLVVHIAQKDAREELEEMLLTKRKYEKELELLKIQLSFVCSVCYGRNLDNVEYVRRIVPEEMIYRYLKSNVQPEFKEIFMRILISIYLNAMDIQNERVSPHIILHSSFQPKARASFEESSLTSRFMNEEDGMEIGEKGMKHSLIIQKIQNLVLEITRKAISNELIDCAFYMYIKTLRKFFSLKVLDEHEIIQFKRMLTDFIVKFHKESFKDVEKKNIVLEILKIIKEHCERQMQFISQELIFNIKHGLFNTPKEIGSDFKVFEKKYKFFTNQLEKELEFIPVLINESIQFSDPEMFLGISELFQTVKRRKTTLIKELKDKIILDSEWSVGLYHRIFKLNAELKTGIREILTMQMDPKEKAAREHKLNHLITQLNYLFYETSSGKSEFSTLTQSIYRELDTLETISWLVSENQRKIKEESKNKLELFGNCFEFLSYYLRDSEENFHRFKAKYLDIQYIFEHADCGQVKFLSQLVKMPIARKLMLDEIMKCILLTFKTNSEPNPYSLLSLLNVLAYSAIEKERLEKFVASLLRKPELLGQIFKVASRRGRNEFLWSYNPKEKNFHKNWLLYAMLLVKFCLLLLENSSERAALAIEIQKCLNLPNMVELLLCPDLTVGVSNDHLCGTILKKEAIKLFQRVYMNELDAEDEHVENLFSMVQHLFQSMAYMKDDLMGTDRLLEDLMDCKTDHLAIIQEVEAPQGQEHRRVFESYMDSTHMSIIVYYPFIIKVLETLTSGNAYIEGKETLKKEGTMMMDAIFRKFKEQVQKLKYGEYAKWAKLYRNAILSCEEIFKRKVGFSLEVEEEEEPDADIKTEQFVLMNRKLENTKKCYLCASNEAERLVYKTFLQMFHSEQLKEHLTEFERASNLPMELGQLEKLLKLIMGLIQKRPEDLNFFFEYFLMYLDGNMEKTKELHLQTVRDNATLLLEKQKNDPVQRNLCQYLSISSAIFQEKIDREDEDTKERNVSDNLYKEEFITHACKVVGTEKRLYLGSKFQEQLSIYSQNELLCFERVAGDMSVEVCLTWIRNYLSLLPAKTKTKCSHLFLEVVDLLQSYTDFVKEFNCKYMTRELARKINLCLQILYHSLSGLTAKDAYTNYLMESQIWNDLNTYLGLDDGWSRNLDELHDDHAALLTKAVRNQLRSKSKAYLTQTLDYYNATKALYHDLIPESFYPLLPTKSLFADIKTNAIAILKEFKQFPLEMSQQLFMRTDLKAIDNNIVEAYIKHENLFTKYGIPSVDTDIDYGKEEEWREVARNVSLENGVDLTSLKMYIEAHYAKGDVQTEYYNQRLEALGSKKIQSAFTSLWNFIRDFFLLFISCFLVLCRKKGQKRQMQEIDEGKMQVILKFFLQKLGRVEVQYDNNIYQVQFMIKPQCIVNEDINTAFIKSINFISFQLKLESIMNQASEFILFYNNEISFYKRFHKFSVITFLTKNFQMLNYLNFVVIVAQNIILIANSTSNQAYFLDTNPEQPFVWMQIISTSIAGLILVAYLIKDFPLLLQNIDLKLKRRSQSYGSSYKDDNVIVRVGIKIGMVIVDADFAYRILYSLVVGLVFYNKLFVALLLLDIFFQIPLLKNLLISIWRPKVQLILAIISFILVQYFFSIIMFFSFQSQTYKYCDTLSSCFGFVFVTTYKEVGGFVGFLFDLNSSVSYVNFFDIFQDIYVVLVFQIFFSLILAIIIDAFSLIRTEQTVRSQYLNSFCIVCNQNKSSFNSSKLTFRTHIAINHNIWNYFFYYQYVNKKSSIRRTPYERFIFLSNNANWLPTNKSKDLLNLQPQKAIQ